MTTIRSVLLPFDLTARREAVRSHGDGEAGPLAPLADSLAHDLEPLLLRTPPIPPQKARLTRIGGRCPVHGGLLEFDPWSPAAHRCARCDRDYVAREHDDWWAMNAQLWTVERAVHAATLFALRDDPAHATLAARILSSIAERYASWPNRDNVLGPSRPFFSTYLESIWLLNACHALALLEAASAPDVYALGATVRDRLIEPSAALIASFHEGTSNRQVWNEVASLTALRMLDDRAAIDRRLTARGGLPWIVQNGVLDDGTWYEGENYHLFAHRGLWYGAQLLHAYGVPLEPKLESRFRAGFVTPFVGVLPDDTFPSRRDSQYAVSIRQWRVAEWCELGYAYTRDERIAGVLTRLYDGTAPTRDSERARSTADAERNSAPSALTRADMSWRGLLGATPTAPPKRAWGIASACLPSQGLAVLRREQGRTYVALEGGHDGGGHGHPDRLALTLQTGRARWLEDPGTGSYVDPSLHWYRSTLAHAAPLVDGRSQSTEHGELLAFEERGGAGWMWKRVRNISPGVTMDRTIVVADGYLVDVLEWRPEVRERVEGEDEHELAANALREHEITMPIAGAGEITPAPVWVRATLPVPGGLEDGFDFLGAPEVAPLSPRVLMRAHPTVARPDGDGAIDDNAALWYGSSAPGVLMRAQTPGAPEHDTIMRHWLRVRGTEGCITGVWCWPSGTNGALLVEDVDFEFGEHPRVIVTTTDGTRAEHQRAPHGWHIELHARHARSSVDLEGLVVTPQSTAAPRKRVVQGDAAVLVPTVNADAIVGEPGDPIDGALTSLLDEPFYVRTELSWREADCPTAFVQLAATETEFVADVDVRTGQLVIADAGIENPLDNEKNDINGDGLQWYLAESLESGWVAGAIVVPDVIDSPRVVEIVPGMKVMPKTTWRPTRTGWAVRLVWRRANLPRGYDGIVRFDLVINERSVDRERRRGQLVLSGGGGFGYLRGDRHEPARSLRLSLA